VISDEVLLSALSNEHRRVPLYGTRVLALADGRRVYACRDCDFLGERTGEEDGMPVLSLRGDIRKHRYEKHGSAKPGPAKGRRRGGGVGQQSQTEQLPLDEIDEVGLPHPNEHVRGMTIGDVVEFAESADQWARVMARLTADRDHWRERALVAEKWKKKTEQLLGKLLPSGEGDD
jgi:hypothetical protein